MTAVTISATGVTPQDVLAVARGTAWKDFAARSANTAKVLKMAEEV